MKARRHAELGPHPVPRLRGTYARCLATYARQAMRLADDRELDRLILRTASRRSVELLALMATDGRLRYSDIMQYVRQPGVGLGQLEAAVGRPLELAYLVRLARVVALQNQLPDDRVDALQLMHWIHREAGSAVFSGGHARLYQNLAFELGDHALATRILDEFEFARIDELVMRADLANPYTGCTAGDSVAWSAHFARLFSRDGLEAPVLSDPVERGETFDRLDCQPGKFIAEGPVVSVIVTAWQPGVGLFTALRSLINQSWRNLEILVIDDASPDVHESLLREAAALDPRIRLIRLESNGGTYRARNTGLMHATGEFVTGQDSDDWSHPRRIERQVAALLRHSKLVSTTSHALRCDPNLLFNSPGTQTRRENASSLMFRRQPVLQKVGFYDDTRKGGDTEYMLRIAKVFGERSHRVLDPNLALIRMSRDSLSTAEFRPGWRHPARAAYRRSYEYWHASTHADALRIEPVDGGGRRFPLPLRFAAAGAAEPMVDVLFVADLRGVNDPQRLRALLDEVRCALRSGLKVGLLHLRSFRDMSFERIDTFWKPFAQLLQDGAVREVLSTDPLKPRLMVVRHPEVAQFLEPGAVAVRPQRVVVIAEESFEEEGDVWYAPMACQKNLRQAFGREVEWRADGEIAQQLEAVLPASSRITGGYPLVIDVPSWRAPSRDQARRRPILGHIASGRSDEFPTNRETLLCAYPPTGRSPARFLGGRSALRRILGSRPVPASWSILPYRAMDPEVFLSSCDFFVWFGPSAARRSTQRLITQALASGCVVIMPPEEAEPYGDAVLAAPAEAVAEVVSDLWARSDEFSAQVARGIAYALTFSRFEPVRPRGAVAPDAAPVDQTGPDPHALSEMPCLPVLRDYLRRAHGAKDAARLDATILRMGSDGARDLLAALASRGRLSAADLVGMAESLRAPLRRPEALAALRNLDPRALIRFARVLVVQALWPDDRTNGVALCEAVAVVHGGSVVEKRFSKIFLDAALVEGNHVLARQLALMLPLRTTDRTYVDIDLAHPFWGGRPEEWLRAFNGIFRRHSLSEMALLSASDRSQDLFDLVDFDVPEEDHVHEGPLVSVVITAWRPTVALLTSVRSILGQTWKNIEVIIVDDASPPGFEALLETCVRMDERVVLLRHATNQGTYVARNTAMAVAKGEFITFQDSDDFSHPSRIELQLRPLLAAPELVATKSGSVHVSEGLLLASPGSHPLRGNASSLLFRRKKVLEKIGFFDTVRKGADTEYALRMASAFGQPVLELDADMPLALVRLVQDSLSRAEFKPGWRHPARAAYREAYEVWHQRIREGAESPYRSADVAENKFPVPLRFQVSRNRSVTYDVAYVGDWRDLPAKKSMLEDVAALVSSGLRVAVCHMEAFRFMTKEKLGLCTPIREMIHRRVLDQVVLSDDISVRLAIIRHPPVLQFVQAGQSAWQVSAAVIVADEAPGDADGIAVRYTVADCIRNARFLWKVDPRWAPEGARVRKALHGLVPAHMIEPFDMPPAVNPDQWSVTRHRPAGARPVIGRYSRDDLLNFPGDPDTLLRAYPDSELVHVRIMGGDGACRQLLGERPLPNNWELLPSGAEGAMPFLESIDYFVYFDRDDAVDAVERPVVEAIASGCVAVLPVKYRPIFGDAAVYCAPEEVLDLILGLEAEADRKRGLLARAAGHFRHCFSRDAYLQRLRTAYGLEPGRIEVNA